MPDDMATGRGMFKLPQYYDDCSWNHWTPERRSAFDKLCRSFRTGSNQEDDSKEPGNK